MTIDAMSMCRCVMTPEFSAASQLEIDMLGREFVAINKFDRRARSTPCATWPNSAAQQGSLDHAGDQIPVFGTMAASATMV
jgi:putative protein kinase ArgK-like GTPase of G3E family